MVLHSQSQILLPSLPFSPQSRPSLGQQTLQMEAMNCAVQAENLRENPRRFAGNVQEAIADLIRRVPPKLTAVSEPCCYPYSCYP